MSGDKLTVTQHAREAVAKQVEAAFYDECEYAQEMRQGLHDSDPNLQHFARFEAETTARATTELVEALRGVVSHFPGEQGPGHSHGVPGVWDEDNHPALAGTKCEWCAHWEKVKALTLHDRALGK